MKRHALLVGVETYEDPRIAPLSFAAADAIELGRCLEDSLGFDSVVVLASDAPARRPTLVNIVNALQDATAELAPEDLFLFFFAGHGITHHDDTRLLVRDTPNAYPEMASLSLRFIRDALSRMRARQRLLLFDACRNTPHAGRGADHNLMDAHLARDIQAVARDQPDPTATTAILTSCGPGQRAYEWPSKSHGVFTHYVLEAIRDASRADEPITFHGIASHAIQRVGDWSSRTPNLPTPQTPVFEQHGLPDSITLRDRETSRRQQPPRDVHPAEEQTEFTVSIKSAGDKVLQVIKEVRAITKLGMRETKDLVEGGGVVKKAASKDEAAEIKAKLEAAGAVIEVNWSSRTPNLPTPQTPGFHQHGLPDSITLRDRETSRRQQPPRDAHPLAEAAAPVRRVARPMLCVHKAPVYAVAYSQDGSWLASGAQDGEVRIWDSRTSQCVHSLVGHTDRISSLAATLDGRFLASGSWDRTIRLWCTESGRCESILGPFEGSVQSLTFTHDEPRLLAHLWPMTLADLGADTMRGSPGRFTATMLHLWHMRVLSRRQYSRDVEVYLTLSTNGAVEVSTSLDHVTTRALDLGGPESHWNPSTGEPPLFDGFLRRGEIDTTPTLHARLEVDPNGAGPSTYRAVVFEGTGNRYTRRKSLPGAASTVAFSPDGSLLAIGASKGGSVRLWWTNSWKPAAKLEGHDQPVINVAFHPDGQSLASASYDRTIHLWDVAEYLDGAGP